MKSILDPLETHFRGVTNRLLEALGAGADVHAGSVIRTLVEAYAREMATFYAMLDRAHQAGYLDTATGGALDSVVALLRLERARAGRLHGKIELIRGTPTPRDIRVSAGFRVTGRDPGGEMLPIFETVEDVVLVAGTTRVLAAVQELADASRDSTAIPSIGPNLLTMTPRPALGIESLTNPDPIVRNSVDETDENLRARAKMALRQSQRGTLESIKAAILEQGISQVEVHEREDGPPGVIDVLIGDPEFERDLTSQARVSRALQATKAAGIRARVAFLRTVFIQPEMSLKPADPELDERGFARLAERVSQALIQHVGSLPSGTAVNRRKLEAVVLTTPGVDEIQTHKVGVRTVSPDPQAPTDPTRLVVHKRQDTSELLGYIEIEASERASIDPEKWPPILTREVEAVGTLDLVIAVTSLDTNLEERVRTNVQKLVGRFHELGDRGQQKFLTKLKGVVQEAGARGIELAIITAETGVARTLNGSETLNHPALDHARMVLGGLKFVVCASELEPPS
ncbi:MAG: hypothetical protein ACPG4T_02665 [Nannocystaceae bacterium]